MIPTAALEVRAEGVGVASNSYGGDRQTVGKPFELPRNDYIHLASMAGGWS